MGCVCLDPVLYVSLRSSHHTTAGIKSSGYFSINIPSVELLPQAGLVSGKDRDKSTLFRAFFDEAGDAPMIEECPMNFLCKVFQTVEIRGFDVFYGEIVAAYVSEDRTSDSRPDVDKMSPFIMMGAAYYSLDKMIGRPFQEGKTLV